MRKSIFYLIAVSCGVLSWTSCSDDNISVARELMPTRVSWDGITLLDLIYDTEGKLIRLDHYYDAIPASNYVFEYDEQGIRESRRYDPSDHALKIRTGFVLDNYGRIIKAEQYTAQSDFKEVGAVTSLSYDPSGRLIRRTNDSGNATFVQEFTYDEAGRLLVKQTRLSLDQLSNIGKGEYTPDKSSYNHWNNFVALMIITGYDDFFWEMFAIGKHYTAANQDGETYSDYQTTATERQFNSDGYLTRQILTTDEIIGQYDSVHEMTYEYTE